MSHFLRSSLRIAAILPACLVAACSSSSPGNQATSGTPDAGSMGGGSMDAGAGGGPLPWSPGNVPQLPQDKTLRVTHVQAKGTHNSYHVETPGNTLPDWHYTLAPLDVQLGEQGVRQLELDLHLVSLDADFEVFHLELVDQDTTCLKLRDCLTTIGKWSDAHPGHLPLYVQFEPKAGFTTNDPEGYFAKLEAEVLSVFVKERIVTPDEVQGSGATLGEAVAQQGWPTLGQTRGRIIFMFDNDDDVRAAYSRGGTSLKDRLIFVDSAPGDATAAVAILNDPVPQAAQIQAALAANMMVRTMSDDPTNDDPTAAAGLVASLSSGATWLSTNFPAPVPGRTYSSIIPGGTPARCNPVTAPASCTSQDIENLGP